MSEKPSSDAPKNSKGYWLGRSARRDGQPRELIDGRYSAVSRAQWFRGWDDEDRMRAASARTLEQRLESAKVISRLKDFVSTL